MSDISELVLVELRELRTDHNTHAREVGERLAALELGMRDLRGNGQPGRITLLEAAIDDLRRWRWWLLGAGAGVSCVVSIVGWIVLKG